MSAPYGYRQGDGREILVHVVGGDGWSEYGAMAMCGAGLDRSAPWPVAPQKWCRRCTDPRYRYVTDTHIWPAGFFEKGSSA